jgi:hypothetical protein
MKIVSSIKTIARNVRFLCTVDMQDQHKLLKHIERTQLRQEDDIESFGHRLDDMPEQIDVSVTSAMDNYEIADDIRDAVDSYDFSQYLEELADHIDVSDEIEDALSECDFPSHIESWMNYHFEIDDHVDWHDKVNDHTDYQSIADVVDKRIEGNDFAGTFEELTEKVQNLELQQTSLVQGLSVRFGKLAQSLLFSTDWSQEAEKHVTEFEEAEDINEVIAKENEDVKIEVVSDPICDALLTVIEETEGENK